MLMDSLSIRRETMLWLGWNHVIFNSRSHSSHVKAIICMGENVSDGDALGKSIPSSFAVLYCCSIQVHRM